MCSVPLVRQNKRTLRTRRRLTQGRTRKRPDSESAGPSSGSPGAAGPGSGSPGESRSGTSRHQTGEGFGRARAWTNRPTIERLARPPHPDSYAPRAAGACQADSEVIRHWRDARGRSAPRVGTGPSQLPRLWTAASDPLGSRAG